MVFGLGLLFLFGLIIWILLEENKRLKQKYSDNDISNNIQDELKLKRENEIARKQDNKNYKELLGNSEIPKINKILSKIYFPDEYFIHWLIKYCNNQTSTVFPHLFNLSLELISIEIADKEINFAWDQSFQKEILMKYISKRLFEIRDLTKTNLSISEMNDWAKQLHEELSKNISLDPTYEDLSEVLHENINRNAAISDAEVNRVLRGTLLNYIDSFQKVYIKSNER